MQHLVELEDAENGITHAVKLSKKGKSEIVGDSRRRVIWESKSGQPESETSLVLNIALPTVDTDPGVDDALAMSSFIFDSKRYILTLNQ